MSPKSPAVPLLTWVKRFAVYLIGLYLMAIGVVFSARSSLGVSPVGSLANVLYQIGLDRGAPNYVNLGNCTIAVYALYILTEFLLLRKDFKASMLLQLVASVLFGWLVNLATAMLGGLPAPGAYITKLLYLLCSIPLVACGVMLYLSPQILPTPGEGMSLAISKKTGLTIGSSKMVFDCSLVAISCAVSLLYFHGLVGVREGTVICALLVGFVMRLMMRVCEKPLMRFVERDTKLQAAMGGEAYLFDETGKPKLLITVSGEFGSGWREIAEKLAHHLGVRFYGNDELIPLEAAESGLDESFIRKHEHNMAHAVVYDFMTAGYAVNMELSPLETLFAAQTRVLRGIAQKNESCVLVGRCSDYILYNDPNSFRIFIHAPTDFRVERVSESMGISQRQAAADLATTDASRARHYEHFTGRPWGDTKYYNLTIDTRAFGDDKCLELIEDAIRIWCQHREIDYEAAKAVKEPS